MRYAALFALLLLVGGCVSDSDTPNLFSWKKREAADPDKPKQACEYTSVGGEPKTVCY